MVLSKVPYTYTKLGKPRTSRVRYFTALPNDVWIRILEKYVELVKSDPLEDQQKKGKNPGVGIFTLLALFNFKI